MSSHIKALGLIYIACGWLVVVCAAMFLLGEILIALGWEKGTGKRLGFLDVANLFLLILGVAVWFLQAGKGLLRRQKSARMFASILAGILLIGLNVVFLLTTAPNVLLRAVHGTCILLGTYALIVLLPGWANRFFDGPST